MIKNNISEDSCKSLTEKELYCIWFHTKNTTWIKKNLPRPHDAKPTNLANDALFAGLLAAEPEDPLVRKAAGLLVVDKALKRAQKKKRKKKEITQLLTNYTHTHTHV